MKINKVRSDFILGAPMPRKRLEYSLAHGKKLLRTRPRKAWLLNYRDLDTNMSSVVGILSPRMKRKTVELIARGIWDCLHLCPGEMLTNLKDHYLRENSSMREMANTSPQYEQIEFEDCVAERGDYFTIGNKSGRHLEVLIVHGIIEKNNFLIWQEDSD
jgi:hypothetical protein